jgi:hypothetical protein
MVRQSEVVYNRKWKIALVTDSTCDLEQEVIDNYQINMLPLNVNFGENNYLDRITIQNEQFYNLLDESKEYPKSSQVNEKAFINLYSHLASHYDSIIAVHLSEKLSGTFNSSQKAAAKISKEFNKQISVINSKSISGAMGLIIQRTAQAIEEGYSHDEVVKMAEKWSDNSRIFVSVKTMKYMIRSGRVSRFKGLIAKILNITPIVSIDETGKAVVFDKAFNQRANMEKVLKHIKKINSENKIWNYVVLHANNIKAAKWYSKKMESLTGIKATGIVNISPVLGVHAGIGAAAVALLFD